MERDGWPEQFRILPSPLEAIKAAGKFLLHLPDDHGYHSDHFRHNTPEVPNTGGAPMLDQLLEQARQAKFERSRVDL